ncbi:MAG: ThiF family adenylyltransferase [Sandaracinaceae bacterium]
MSRVVVVGAGALGSHVLQFLRNLEGELAVVDFDRVELKNVLSQFHAKNTVGQKKVVGLTRSMAFLFGTKIDGTPHRLDEGNAEALLGAASLVIDCLDNAASRRVVQSTCRDRGIPCLHGALDDAGTFGRVVWSEAFVLDEEPEGGAATCEDGAFLPFIALTAAYLAYAAQAFLTRGAKLSFSVHPGGAFAT